MLRAVNVNNTHTLVGLYDGETLVVHWRIRTDQARTVDEWVVVLRGLFGEWGNPRPPVDGIVLGRVVPPMNERIEELCRRLFGEAPLVVGPGVRTGVPLLYDNPREIGADRIANAVAATERIAGPSIVVDFGTATTFDVVTAKGEYAGGVIVPGIGISLDALIARTAKLPRVELAWPPKVVGRTTVHAIQSGVTYGYTALVDGMVERIRAEQDPRARVIATGGLAPFIAPHSSTIESVDEFLTLDGLRIIHARNGGRHVT
jgi:type III pantothenate kinase